MRTAEKMEQRRKKILELISQTTITSISDLAKYFSVSYETIRKDIDFLDRQKQLIRIHGGVAPYGSSSAEPPYNVRSVNNLEKKQTVARAAFQMIRPGDSIILENGTTLEELAKLIAEDKELTESLLILTMSFRIIELFKDCNFSNIFFLGGRIRKDDLITYGPHAIAMLKNFNVDKSFIGCAAISKNLVACDYFDAEISLRQQIIESSSETILLADSSKIGKSACFSVCSLDKISNLITNSDCPEEFLSIIEKNNISYTLA